MFDDIVLDDGTLRQDDTQYATEEEFRAGNKVAYNSTIIKRKIRA